MGERTEAIALARKVLDEPGADPDNGLRLLARQLVKQAEAVDRLKAALANLQDPYSDLVAANRDVILEMHEEAVRRVRKALESDLPGRRDLALEILDALARFHPMYGESFPGWPERS